MEAFKNVAIAYYQGYYKKLNTIAAFGSLLLSAQANEYFKFAAHFVCTYLATTTELYHVRMVLCLANK